MNKKERNKNLYLWEVKYKCKFDYLNGCIIIIHFKYILNFSIIEKIETVYQTHTGKGLERF